MIVYRLGLNGPLQQHSSSDTGTRDGEIMGLVKTRRLAAMRKAVAREGGDEADDAQTGAATPRTSRV